MVIQFGGLPSSVVGDPKFASFANFATCFGADPQEALRSWVLNSATAATFFGADPNEALFGAEL